IKPVTWQGDFTTSTAGLTVTWKWGAAVYTTDMSNLNALGVKPTHNASCLYSNGDHAGTPEDQKASVVGGARGGGGSNWTGSWSGSQTLQMPCAITQLSSSMPVTGLQLMDTTSLTWNPATNAMYYDIIRGDLQELRTTRTIGGAFCHHD